MHGTNIPASIKTPSRSITVRIARDPNDLMLVTAIRSAVYLAEQDCPIEEEFDGNDLVAAHFLGFVGTEPAGCLRVRFFGEFAKVERLAVRHQFRRSRLSFKLVQASVDYVKRKGFKKIYGQAQDRLDVYKRQIWESAGFKVALFDDIKQMVWEKLIMNVAFSGSSCITGMTIGQILEDADAWSVARGCAEEAVAVAKASSVRLDVGDPIEHIKKLGGKIPDARPSMLLDYNAGRRCEVDAINGAIPRLGKPLGVATPVNDTVIGLIKARERRMLAG